MESALVESATSLSKSLSAECLAINDLRRDAAKEIAALISQENVVRQPHPFSQDVLSKLQSAAASDIEAHRQRSVSARKNLAAKTKEFKALNDESKLSQLGGLIKLFQVEVDSLTKRSVFSEDLVTAVQSEAALSSEGNEAASLLPSPAPESKAALDLISRLASTSSLLDTAAGELQSLAAKASEADKLREEIEDFEREFSTLKNQDLQVRRLEDKLKSQELQFDSKLKEALQHQREELLSKAEQESKELSAQGDATHRRVQELTEENSRLQESINESRSSLLSQKCKFDEETSGLKGQLDLRTEELERALKGLDEAEQTSSELRNQYTTAWKQVTFLKQKEESLLKELSQVNSSSDKVQELQSRCNEIETRLFDTERQLENARQKLALSESQLATMESVHGNEISRLQQELEAAPPVNRIETLVSEVAQLKTALYDTLTDELREDIAGAFPNAHGELKELERNLVARNKSLQARLTLEKNARQMLEKDKQELQTQVSDLAQQVDRLNLQSKLVAADSTESAILSRIGSEVAEEEPDSTSVGSPSVIRSSNSDHALVELLSKQRDKLKQQCSKLEQANFEAEAEKAKVSKELKSVRQDNVKLFSKLQATRRGDSIGNVDEEAMEARYLADSSSAFAEFGSRLKNSGRHLDIADRITLDVSRFFLGSTHARRFLVIYIILLHVLVTVSLWFMSHKARCPKCSNVAKLPSNK